MSEVATYNYNNCHYYDTVFGNLPGAQIWERFPVLSTRCDPFAAFYHMNDFDGVTPASDAIGGWTTTKVTSGTVTQETSAGQSLLLLSAGAVTANQGVNVQLNCQPLKIVAYKPIIFEALLKFTGLSATPKFQMFVGVAAASTALIASGAMAATDRIGFQGITTTGVVTSVARGGGTAVTSTGVTVADTVFHRYGFYATSAQIDFYIDGALVGTSATSQIPTGFLAPTFVCQANATVTPVMAIDYVAWAGCR